MAEQDMECVACAFAKQGGLVVGALLDGQTVAWDMHDALAVGILPTNLALSTSRIS